MGRDGRIKVELKSIDAGVYFSSDAGNPDTAAHFYADFEMFTDWPVQPVSDRLHAALEVERPSR